MSCECAIYAINLFDYAKIKYLVAENFGGVQGDKSIRPVPNCQVTKRV